MTTIKINHKDWVDNIILDEDLKIAQRISENKDKGTYILNDNFLLINWEKWSTEYFFKKELNKSDFYYISDDGMFELYNYVLSIIYVINNGNIGIFLIDIKNQNIYFKKNLIFYSKIIKHAKNELYLDNNEILIYFNYKYYEKSYFLKIYTLINIDGTEYILKNNSVIYYKDYNIYDSGEYQKYKNVLQLKSNDKLYKSNDNYNYFLYIPENENCYNIKDEIIVNNAIFFIINNKNIYNLIKIIDYYKYFNIDCFILDIIDNKDNYYLFEELDILYYNNNDDLSLFIEKNNKNTFFVENKLYHLNKFNNLIYIDQTFDIILLHEKIIKEKDIQKIWFNLNKEIVNKYDILINSDEKNIPKFIHFIWLGNNKFPIEYENYIKSWLKNYPNYIFCFWNDHNIPKLVNQKYFDEAKSFAMKADILRYELLYFFGGIYVDTDFLSIQNFDKLIENKFGFSGYESNEHIAIGLMGFKKYDNILFQLITKLSFNIDRSDYIPELTGPLFFTRIWNMYKSDKYIAFPVEYFYSYRFQDKLDNKKYIIDNSNLAIHMWGYSWSKDNKKNINNLYLNNLYINNLFLENIIESNINKIKYSEIDDLLKSKIYFNNIYNKNSKKPKIVHIMGMFFTGGIEKYLYYIDKYGSHDKFQYYLLYIGNKNEYEKTIYNIKNILMISYEWNHLYLNNLLSLIKPDLIIDHYSLYLEKNRDIYENITKNIIYFVHSAILYNNNISNLNINKCIHLYDEPNKENSWLEIENNYYITLGTEKRIEIERYLDIDIKKIRIEKSLENETLYLEDEKEKELEIENETLLETEKFIEIENKINSKRNSYFKKSKNNKFKKNKIFISIIGRIAEEKIPIIFLEKLVILAKNIFNYIEIHIYGEKDYTFNKEYINNFNNIILNSKIKVHDFIHPDNLKDVFLKTNFLLIPSIYETGSFTCLEAFSYGIPVIARNVYGLKFLIEDNITGFLGDSDEEILSIINNIKNNTILENRNLIIEKSLKYDIVEKINDLEFIIEEECNPKNLVIITSVLNICDKPLSYYDIRSVFNIEERVKQTIKTIKSLKQFIPNLEILFCECSNIDIETEELIKSNVNYFYNFNNNQEIKEKVDSKYKGWGEAVILLEGMKYIKKYYYKNIFKISGRYYLNNLFDYQKFNNSYNIFSLWDNSNKSLCTIFYKINMYSLEIFKEKLFNSLPFLETGNSIEWIIYNFFSDHIIIFDKLNISGYLSTEGYLFSV